MKVIVVFKRLVAKWERPTWPPSIQMGVTAGIFWLQFTKRDAPI